MILVFGTICIDRIRPVPFLPPPGGYVEATSELFLLGGEAANTANALRTWGVPYALYGNAFAHDLEGERLRQLMIEYGLENREQENAPFTPVCDIYVTPDGDRTMFGIGFTAMEAGVDVATMPVFESGWFTAEPNMVQASKEAAIRAKRAGMRLYLMDFAGDREVLGEGVFWQSSTDMVGTRGDVEENLRWVREQVDEFGCFTILSDGPNGFVAGSPTHAVRAYAPYLAPKTVDTTGAGDLFRAGMLRGLSEGWEIERCLRFASAAGALSCRALGATTDVPTVPEIEDMISS